MGAVHSDVSGFFICAAADKIAASEEAREA